MARRVLDLMIWHPKGDIKKCKISYLHRGAPKNLKVIKGSEIKKLEKGFMILRKGTAIPYHRIVKIECRDMLIWRKREKG